MSLPRAHFRHNWGILGLSRRDSTWLKPVSGACPGRDSNPHEGNPHRILSPCLRWLKSDEIPINPFPHLPLNLLYRVIPNDTHKVSSGTIVGRHSGTCQQVRDTRVENLSSRRRLSWRVDPHLVRRSGDSSLWVDEPLGMPGAGLIENMLAPLDDSVGLAMMNHGRR